MSSYASADLVRREIAQLLRPPKRMPVAEAVAKFVRVKTASGNWSAWDPEVTPYMVEPLNLMDSRRYSAVVFVGPARSGKTQTLVDGAIGYATKCDPLDALIVQITQEKAAEYSKKRIKPMLENSPELRKLLSARGHDNNIHDIIMRAGNYLKLGWPAKSMFASSDWRWVLLTDYDRSDAMLDVGGEGDGFTLASKRTQTFRSRGMTVAESSPGREILDPLWRPTAERPHEFPPCTGIGSLYNMGDRRVLYWPCQHCGEFFPARWESLRYDTRETDLKAASESVVCVCHHCGGIHEPTAKEALKLASAWVPEGCRISPDRTLTGTPRNVDIASFWMEGPAAAFQTWQSLVYRYLTALRDFEMTGAQEKLKSTVNTDQGRPYLYVRGDRARSSDRLADRKEATPRRQVPVEARFLIACVDVQGGKDRRFVVQVHAIGEHSERWIIDRYNIKTSARTGPNGESLPIEPGAYAEDWDQLTAYILDRGYPISDDSGRHLAVKLVVCDHGGEDGVSDNAYAYYRRLRLEGKHQRLMLVKGASGRQEQLIRVSYPDNSKRDNRKARARGDVPLHVIDTDALKDRISAKLDRENPGAGFIHLPDWAGQWFYDELCAETRDASGHWSKATDRAPNEAFDLLNYCEAGITHLQAHVPKFWQAPPPWALPLEQNSLVYRDDEAEHAPRQKTKSPPRRTRFRFQ